MFLNIFFFENVCVIGKKAVPLHCLIKRYSIIMAKKIYKVMAECTYRERTSEYCVGKFSTKREANACLNRLYTTPSRTFYIEVA